MRGLGVCGGGASCADAVVDSLDEGSHRGGERHVERQVDAKTQHHRGDAQAVQGDARDNADAEPGDAGDAGDHGGDNAGLGGDEELAGAEGFGAVRAQQRRHDGDGDDAAQQRADCLTAPQVARVGADDGAGFEIAHDVAGKTACDGDDCCDEEQLHLVMLAHGGDYQKDDEAEDLHGVDAGLTHGLRAHDGGDKGERYNHNGGDRGESQHQTGQAGGGCREEAQRAGVHAGEAAQHPGFIVRVLRGARPGGAAALKVARGLGQDVLDHHAQAGSHHETHAQT